MADLRSRGADLVPPVVSTLYFPGPPSTPVQDSVHCLQDSLLRTQATSFYLKPSNTPNTLRTMPHGIMNLTSQSIYPHLRHRDRLGAIPLEHPLYETTKYNQAAHCYQRNVSSQRLWHVSGKLWICEQTGADEGDH